MVNFWPFTDSKEVRLLRDVIDQGNLTTLRLEILMSKLDDLQAAVGRNHDAEDSVIALLRGISQQLKDAIASNDPAKLDALVAEVDASTEKLAAAVVENTPASPDPAA